jgi:hypothetical protein
MRDPINLFFAVAFCVCTVAWFAMCTKPQAAKAPGDAGWHAVILPADFDAGNGSLR